MDPAYSNNDYGGVGTVIEEKVSKANGDQVIRRYAKGPMLGKGGFAKCFRVTNLDNQKVSAAKIIEKSSLSKSRARQKLISEIKIHKSLSHTNIVKFEHVFEDQENVYILLELCSNQTLNELLKRRKRLTELEVQCYLIQCIAALKFMQSNRVIHRDLKLGNLFLNDKMEIKFGDFGLAAKVEFDGEKKKTICGTPNYIAPEVLDGKIGHSYEVDIWSLGVILYTLLVGKPPYETPDVKTTYKKIRMNSYSFPDHVPLSDSAKNLITKVLVLDPSKRLTLDEILEHPFLNNGGTIPKLLPVSTLVCPPSASYVKQFLPQATEVKLMVQPQRLVDTAPLGQLNNIKLQNNQRSNLISTDRVSLKNRQSIENNTDRQPSGKGDGITGTQLGNVNLNTAVSTNSLRSSLTQQKDLKSPRGLSASGGFGTNKFGGKTDSYVKKWVDYSSKYGIGYLLSNGSTGVFFNDSSKIISDIKGMKFDYIFRQPNDRQEVIQTHSFSDYPKDLQKKVTLLQHFKSYLEGENKAENKVEEEGIQNEPLIYVKKWMKTKHAVMFRLSNKIVQVNFTDKTEIILSSEKKLVTYVNKKGERSQYPLATALESSNEEMSKRLKYTKEILTHMLGNNPNQGNRENEVEIENGL